MHPRQHAAATPDRPAVILADSGARIDYAALESGANRFAHWLRAHGIGAGAVVALQLVNSIDLFVFVWGAQRAGVHYLMVPTGLTAGELDHIIRDSDAALVLRSPETLGKAPGWVPPAGVNVHVADGALRAAIAEYPATPIADEAPGADMLYSSGTTGRPKGIKGPVPPALDTPSRAERIGGSHFGFGPDSVYLAPAPLYHAAPLRWSLGIHRHGGTVVVMERFDAESALAAIARHGVTVAQFVPTHFARLLALPENVRAAYDLGSLRSVFHAGAPCPVPVKRAMIDWLGPVIHEFYSGTEGLGICVISSEEWLERPGSVGRAVEGIVRICGEDGEPLAAGEEGLIRFEGVAPFSYHKDPERTAAAYNRYGWPTLGDVGRLDADGFLTLSDRADFMIISGGVNVYPQEVEDRLCEHPAVADTAVVGLPDDDLGQCVTAVIEPAAWPVDEAALSAALDAHARAVLAPAKRPRAYLFRPALGRTETGKLQKKKLRAELIAARAAEKGERE